MYLYTQTTDNKSERWQLRKDSDIPEIMATCRHWSVYMQSEQDHDGSDYSKIRLKGDLTIDIDAGGPGQAIERVNKFLDYLEQQMGLDLRYLRIWCSGKKGFHIIIPQSIIGDDRAVPYLNRYHGWMVRHMGEACGVKFDESLYARKHLIRIPGAPRDGGLWKVPVTAEQVRGMTAEEYSQLVAAKPDTPEVRFLIPQSYICTKLGALWSKAKDEVKHLQERGKFAARDSQDLNVFNDDNLPRCIEKMRMYEGVKGGFNETSMNVASFLAQAAQVSDETKDKVVSDFAKFSKSDSRPRVDQRKAHVLGALRNDNLHFSCGANKAVLEGNPCEGCALKAKQDAEAAKQAEIEEREDGYYVRGLRMTTFKLVRQHHICGDDGKTFLADAFIATVYGFSAPITAPVLVSAGDWVSMSSFRSRMSQVPKATVFSTSEVDLAHLHAYLNAVQETESIMQVDKLGIHIIPARTDEETEQRLWVEKDWSLNSIGLSGDYTYSGGAADTVTPLRGVMASGADDREAHDILLKLMHSNKPEVVGTLLGWTAACHLKEHLEVAGFSEFPLMHIAGKPGSGKTATASVYAMLTGASMKGGPMVVDSTTPSPLRQAMSQTTTVARVFDEFNKANMGHNRYLQVLGYLKSAYCRQDIAVGYINRGAFGGVSAATAHQHATSPVIYMSREATENEELRQRSLIIRVSESDHKLENFEANWKTVERSSVLRSPDGTPLARLCKLMVRTALGIDSSTILQWHQDAQHELPLEEHSRRVQNLFVVRLGLRFLRAVFQGFPGEIMDRLAELDRIVISSFRAEESSQEAKRRRWTTSESLMNHMISMAAIGKDDRVPGRLVAGTHYIRRGNLLYMRPVSCHSAYAMYARATGAIMEATSAASMAELFLTAPYCLGQVPLPEAPTARGWYAFDISQMEAKGLFSDFFEEG